MKVKCLYPGCVRTFTPKRANQTMGPKCSRKYNKEENLREDFEMLALEEKIMSLASGENPLFEESKADILPIIPGNYSSKGGSGAYFNMGNGVGTKLMPYKFGAKGFKLDYFFEDKEDVLFKIIEESVLLEFSERSGLTPKFKNLRIAEFKDTFWVALEMEHLNGRRVLDEEIHLFQKEINRIDSILIDQFRIRHDDLENNYNWIFMPDGNIKIVDFCKATSLKKDKEIYRYKMVCRAEEFYSHFLEIWNKRNPNNQKTDSDINKDKIYKRLDKLKTQGR